MANIVILGAGRSATVLINYLANYAQQTGLSLLLADADGSLARQKLANYPQFTATPLNVTNTDEVDALIKGATIVVSMLPAFIHAGIAALCLKHQCHLATASYVGAEMQALHNDAVAANLTFLNECGLDPGIDHLSAMQMIDSVWDKSGEIISFKSYTGGLVAPESDNNPWGYKFSWNPRNVVLAGQGTVKYLRNGNYKYIPYHRLFNEAEVLDIPGHGIFDAYANRDSLAYREVYGLKGIKTLLRGTLRKHHFCKAWNVLVQLGLADDSYKVNLPHGTTYTQWINSYLPENSGGVKERTAALLGIAVGSEAITMVEWLGLFGHEPLGLLQGSPAEILQELLERKWKLHHGDKDMILMHHELTYTLGSKTWRKTSTLACTGQDDLLTAMAKTVGLPLALGVRLILERHVHESGVVIPVTPKWYIPILEELEKQGIVFTETEQELA